MRNNQWVTVTMVLSIVWRTWTYTIADDTSGSYCERECKQCFERNANLNMKRSLFGKWQIVNKYKIPKGISVPPFPIPDQHAPFYTAGPVQLPGNVPGEVPMLNLLPQQVQAKIPAQTQPPMYFPQQSGFVTHPLEIQKTTFSQYSMIVSPQFIQTVSPSNNSLCLQTPWTGMKVAFPQPNYQQTYLPQPIAMYIKPMTQPTQLYPATAMPLQTLGGNYQFFMPQPPGTQLNVPQQQTHKKTFLGKSHSQKPTQFEHQTQAYNLVQYGNQVPYPSVYGMPTEVIVAPPESYKTTRVPKKHWAFRTKTTSADLETQGQCANICPQCHCSRNVTLQDNDIKPKFKLIKPTNARLRYSTCPSATCKYRQLNEKSGVDDDEQTDESAQTSKATKSSRRGFFERMRVDSNALYGSISQPEEGISVWSEPTHRGLYDSSFNDGRSEDKQVLEEAKHLKPQIGNEIIRESLILNHPTKEHVRPRIMYKSSFEKTQFPPTNKVELNRRFQLDPQQQANIKQTQQLELSQNNYNFKESSNAIPGNPVEVAEPLYFPSKKLRNENRNGAVSIDNSSQGYTVKLKSRFSEECEPMTSVYSNEGKTFNPFVVKTREGQRARMRRGSARHCCFMNHHKHHREVLKARNRLINCECPIKKARWKC